MAWDKEAFPAQIEALRAVFVEGVIETVNHAVEAGVVAEPTKPAAAGGSSSSGSSNECPECGGDMWDNRDSKRNPKAPDFKCKDKSCEGVIWPERKGR